MANVIDAEFEDDDDSEEETKPEPKKGKGRGPKDGKGGGKGGGPKGPLDIIAIPALALGFGRSLISMKVADLAARGFDPAHVKDVAMFLESHLGREVVSNGFFPAMESMIGENGALEKYLAQNPNIPPIVGEIVTESLGDYLEQLRRDYLSKKQFSPSDVAVEQVKFSDHLKNRREQSSYSEALFLLSPMARDKVDDALHAMYDFVAAIEDEKKRSEAKARVDFYREQMRGTEALRAFLKAFERETDTTKKLESVLAYFERTYTQKPSRPMPPLVDRVKEGVSGIMQALFGKKPAATAAGTPTDPETVAPAGAPVLPPGPAARQKPPEETIKNARKKVQNWRYR